MTGSPSETTSRHIYCPPSFPHNKKKDSFEHFVPETRGVQREEVNEGGGICKSLCDWELTARPSLRWKIELSSTWNS